MPATRPWPSAHCAPSRLPRRLCLCTAQRRPCPRPGSRRPRRAFPWRPGCPRRPCAAAEGCGRRPGTARAAAPLPRPLPTRRCRRRRSPCEHPGGKGGGRHTANGTARGTASGIASGTACTGPKTLPGSRRPICLHAPLSPLSIPPPTPHHTPPGAAALPLPAHQLSASCSQPVAIESSSQMRTAARPPPGAATSSHELLAPVILSGPGRDSDSPAPSRASISRSSFLPRSASASWLPRMAAYGAPAARTTAVARSQCCAAQPSAPLETHPDIWSPEKTTRSGSPSAANTARWTCGRRGRAGGLVGGGGLRGD